MPRRPMPWFRVYLDVFKDPFLRQRPEAERWLWMAVLGAARQSPVAGALLLADGTPMTDRALADWAGISLATTRRGLAAFAQAEWIHREEQAGFWVVSGWDSRQFESDDVTTRTRRHRENADRRNVPTTFPTPPQRTETENRTSSPPPEQMELPTGTDEEEDHHHDPRVAAAVELEVERRLAARRSSEPVVMVDRWKATTRASVLAEHGPTLESLAVLDPKAAPEVLLERVAPTVYVETVDVVRRQRAAAAVAEVHPTMRAGLDRDRLLAGALAAYDTDPTMATWLLAAAAVEHAQQAT